MPLTYRKKTPGHGTCNVDGSSFLC